MALKTDTNIVALENTPGTHFTRAILSPDDSRGVITAKIKDGVHDLDNFIGWESLFPASWNGVPRFDVTVRAQMGSDAVAWARYRVDTEDGTDSSRFVEENFHEGTASVQLWNDPAGKDIVNVDSAGNNVTRSVIAPMLTIEWGQREFQDVIPPHAIDGLALRGTNNANDYEIAGHSFDPGSLLYVGARIQHIARGGEDQWIYYHVAHWRKVYQTTAGDYFFWAESVLENDYTPGVRDIYPAVQWGDLR